MYFDLLWSKKEYAALQKQRMAALDAFIETEAQRIAELPDRQARQSRLDMWKPDKPARIYERIKERVEAIFAQRNASQDRQP